MFGKLDLEKKKQKERLQADRQAFTEQLSASEQQAGGLQLQQNASSTISNYAQENAKILFGKTKTLSDYTVRRYANATQLGQLTSLRAQEMTAEGKERRRIRHEIASLHATIQQREQAKFDELIDNSVKTLAPAQADRLLASPYAATLDSMRVNLAGNSLLEVADREQLLHTLNDFAGTNAELGRLHFQQAAQGYLERKLAPTMNQQMQSYIANRGRRVEKTLTAFDKRFASVEKKYRKLCKNTAADETTMEHFSQRVTHYTSKHPRVSRQDAEKEILKRYLHPKTLEALDQTMTHYKTTEETLPSFEYRQGRFEERKLYKDQIQDILKSEDFADFLQEMREKHPGKLPELTQEVAEQYVQNYCKDLMANGNYQFRCPARFFVPIAEDKMKSTIELGTAKKDYEISRKCFTRNAYGIKNNDLHPSEYELYGYLGSKSDLLDKDFGMSTYGNVCVKLRKKNLQGRTTTTFGDSLNNHASCSPCKAEAPELMCVGGEHKQALLEMAIRHKLKDKDEDGKLPSLDPEVFCGKVGMDYVELQFHGDVTARDIESLTIHLPENPTSEEGQKELQSIRHILEKVRDINEHPAQYGREGLAKLKVTFPEADAERIIKGGAR